MFCPEEATVNPVPPAKKPTAPVIELAEVTPVLAIAPAPEIDMPVPAVKPMLVRAEEVELRSDKLLAIRSESPVACLLLKVVQSTDERYPFTEPVEVGIEIVFTLRERGVEKVKALSFELNVVQFAEVKSPLLEAEAEGRLK